MFCFAQICSYLAVFALDCALAAHIIGVPSIGLSHGRVLGKIGRELARRGHKYTLLVPSDLEKDLQASSTTQGFQVRSFKSNFTKGSLEALMLNQSVGNIDVKKNLELWVGTCEDMVKSDLYSKSLDDIDLMFCDIGALCCPILADKLGIQRVDISPTGFSDPFLSIIHNFPNPVAYIPQMSYWLPSRLSFFGRVQNTLMYGFGYTLYRFYLIPSYAEVWQKYIPNSKFLNLDELFKSTGLLLIPTDFILTKPRPVAAHVKVIGAILPEPAKPLTPSFQELISSSHHNDVVVVSFGTVISNFSSSFVEILADALCKLPALVIWKHKGSVPSNLGENVKIFSWIPQNDLLGHPRTKLFITHGGLNSVYEATFHGVPMVVIPFFADQFDNAANVRQAGFGETIDLKILTAERIIETATKVLNQESYIENAVRFSNRMIYPAKVSKSGGKTYVQPLTRTPTEQAADWVEYGLYNNAALHLRGEEDNLSFAQLYLLDVLVFLLIMLFLILKVMYMVVKFVVNVFCWRKKSKTD
ncbi:UDP-glucuronosyltransferase 2C1-like [Actinia tenebrosa]|uniref:UDP-glucuronosyltransferase 2C1-like n=1 Tax=Actinia tenebrosa TaxID=6105 RepID=A0A6P8J9Z0_ACTTE|nr:UDP-glucuronosyltransferase 2C1-like [Actinia tenebrosa]